MLRLPAWRISVRAEIYARAPNLKLRGRVIRESGAILIPGNLLKYRLNVCRTRHIKTKGSVSLIQWHRIRFSILLPALFHWNLFLQPSSCFMHWKHRNDFLKYPATHLHIGCTFVEQKDPPLLFNDMQISCRVFYTSANTQSLRIPKFTIQPRLKFHSDYISTLFSAILTIVLIIWQPSFSFQVLHEGPCPRVSFWQIWNSLDGLHILWTAFVTVWIIGVNKVVLRGLNCSILKN